MSRDADGKLAERVKMPVTAKWTVAVTAWLEANKKNQAWLAEQIGTSEPQVSRVLARKHHHSELVLKIADVTGIFDYIYALDDPQSRLLLAFNRIRKSESHERVEAVLAYLEELAEDAEAEAQRRAQRESRWPRTKSKPAKTTPKT